MISIDGSTSEDIIQYILEFNPEHRENKLHL